MSQPKLPFYLHRQALVVFSFFLGIISTEGAADSCVPLPSSAEAWWRADTNIFDELGGYHVEQRGTLEFAAGKIGRSWAFNGMDTEILVDTSFRYGLNRAMDASTTFEAWIAPEAGPNRQTFLTWQTFDAEDVLEFFLQSPSAPGDLWTIGVATESSTMTLLADFTAGEFQHLAISYVPINNTISFHLNGTFWGSSKFSIPGNNYLPRIKLGGRDDARFHGRIDEVVIHADVLDSDQLSQTVTSNQGYCWTPHAPEFVRYQEIRPIGYVGELYFFNAEVKGAGPLSYQWRRNGANLPGEMGLVYMINKVLPSDAGNYDVVVTNNYGAVTSRLARLSISLLANGGFDEGSTDHWIVEDIPGQFLPVKASTHGRGGLFRSAPLNGGYSLTHGFGYGADSAGAFRVMQDLLEISPGLQLSFFYRAGWNQLNSGPAALPRRFQVRIEPNGGGNELFTTNILTILPETTNLDSFWQRQSVDLDPWKGQRIRIIFEWSVPEPGTPAMFELDGIKLLNASGPPVTIEYLPESNSIKLRFSGDAASYTVWRSIDLRTWFPSAEPSRNQNGEFEYIEGFQPFVYLFYKIGTP